MCTYTVINEMNWEPINRVIFIFNKRLIGRTFSEKKCVLMWCIECVNNSVLVVEWFVKTINISKKG